MSSTLFITHGDMDGIVSAALAAKRYRVELDDSNVIFTQPYLVDKIVIPAHIKKVVVTDIARNNRDPVMTDKFIAGLGDRLVCWYDHHLGWEEWKPAVIGLPDPILSESYKNRKIHIEHEPACACILGDENDILVRDAIASDTREGEMSHLGTLIEHAIKANMSDDDIRLAAVKLLLGDESQRPVLESAAEEYATVQRETDWLSRYFEVDRHISMKKCVPGIIAFTDVSDSYYRAYGSSTPYGHRYDLTQLLLTGQRLAKFAVAKTISPETDEGMVTIATKSGVNLVELFGLKGGAPYRVSVPVDRLDEVLEKLNGVA